MPGFRTSDLQLRSGENLTITQPSLARIVTRPVTLEWTVPNVHLIQPGAKTPGVFFAVFVDRPPIRPGQNLTALVDDTCKATPGCANTSYYANENVFLTAGHHLSLDSFPKEKVHNVAVVLVNQANNRVGETVATSQFRVREPRQ
jgi:hypothetical protein